MILLPKQIPESIHLIKAFKHETHIPFVYICIDNDIYTHSKLKLIFNNLFTAIIIVQSDKTFIMIMYMYYLNE